MSHNNIQAVCPILAFAIDNMNSQATPETLVMAKQSRMTRGVNSTPQCHYGVVAHGE